MAVALLDKDAGPEQFTSERVRDPNVQELLKKVHYFHPPELTGYSNMVRYPERVTETHLRLSTRLSPPTGRVTPYLVKVTQVDGQMAWSSPVYVSRRK